MYENKHLGCNVNVTAHTRPIKIAYIVPYGETTDNQWIIDAIFHESYTRWGGARTLIIPADANKFLYPEHEEWLKFYDADFVYSYVALEKELIEKVDYLCCPVAFLTHKNYRPVERWQNYLPDWKNYIAPVSSITTIHSPYSAYPRAYNVDKTATPIVITQYKEVAEERFIADNFGTAWNTINYPNPIPGLLDTLCLVPEGFCDKRHKVGTTITSSVTDILAAVAQKKVLTIAKLAMAHSDNIPRTEPYNWSKSFNIFIGETCLDRINFWNARHLAPHWVDIPGALLVKESLFNDEAFVKELGLFLNNNNYLGHSSQYEVSIRSLSVEKDKLERMGELLKKATYNRVFVPDNYSEAALPEPKELDRDYVRAKAGSTFKVNERENTLQAEEPEHFSFSPMRFYGFNKGQWAIDLTIERHNNLSRYSNVTDIWSLPRRRNATRCFTKNLSKVSKDHTLTIIPFKESHFGTEEIRQRLEYNLSLREDGEFFRCLVTGDIYPLADNDARSCLKHDCYKDIELSDKGQNLRGVVSMFDSLSEAYECLTNRFWREALNKCHTKDALDCHKIFGCLPNTREYTERIKNELRLKDIKVARDYLVASFTDSLEFLVSKNVFYQVHQWRCHYCGHTNTRTIDEIRKENNCEICKTVYLVPIDLEWTYKLNRFVSGSLCERSGLLVLWALGYLQERNRAKSFYYLPEVDLYPEYDKPERSEIDILCVLGGKFYAGEVKKSALGITKGEALEKYIKKIELLRPDVALLVFEQLCNEEGDKELAKTELTAAVEKIQQCNVVGLEVSVIIASDNPQFSEYPIDIGIMGKRTSALLHKMPENI